MKKERQFRSSYLSIRGIELGKRPIYIWGYSKSEEFVCRLEVSAAGIAVYTGKRGLKMIGDYSWERLVRKLSPRAN